MTRGFTLLEVMMVFGLVAIVGGFALFASLDSFRGSTFRSDRDTLVAILQRARAQSMHNICAAAGCSDGAPHGVKILADRIVLFEGADYASRNASIDAAFTLNGTMPTGDDEVVFEQLTGTVAAQRQFHFVTAPRTSDVTVSTSGQIVWTH